MFDDTSGTVVRVVDAQVRPGLAQGGSNDVQHCRHVAICLKWGLAERARRVEMVARKYGQETGNNDTSGGGLDRQVEAYVGWSVSSHATATGLFIQRSHEGLKGSLSRSPVIVGLCLEWEAHRRGRRLFIRRSRRLHTRTARSQRGLSTRNALALLAPGAFHVLPGTLSPSLLVPLHVKRPARVDVTHWQGLAVLPERRATEHHL